MLPKQAHAQVSFGRLKPPVTPMLFISALACTKKNHSLRNGKLKENRASETEDRGKKG